MFYKSTYASFISTTALNYFLSGIQIVILVEDRTGFEYSYIRYNLLRCYLDSLLRIKTLVEVIKIRIAIAVMKIGKEIIKMIDNSGKMLYLKIL